MIMNCDNFRYYYYQHDVLLYYLFMLMFIWSDIINKVLICVIAINVMFRFVSSLIQLKEWVIPFWSVRVLLYYSLSIFIILHTLSWLEYLGNTIEINYGDVSMKASAIADKEKTVMEPWSYYQKLSLKVVSSWWAFISLLTTTASNNLSSTARSNQMTCNSEQQDHSHRSATIIRLYI